MKQAFRKAQYQIVTVLIYNKGENSIAMLFDFIVILTILSRKIPSFLYQYNIAKCLLYFYTVNLALLLICRVFWNCYSRFRYVGIVEVFSNYTYFQVRRVLQTRVKGMSQLDFARGLEALGEAVTKLDGEYPNTPTFFVFTEFEGEIYTDIGVGLQFEEG